jgi:haloacetate dehalogenase
MAHHGPDGHFGPVFGSGFDQRAVRHYLEPLRDPRRVRALCEGYRARAYLDFEHDKTDLEQKRKISVPLHAVAQRFQVSTGDAAAEALPFEPQITVTGAAVEAGRFTCEENPKATETALLGFFKA